RPSIADAEAETEADGDADAGADTVTGTAGPTDAPDGGEAESDPEPEGKGEPTDWDDLTPAVTRVESPAPDATPDPEATDSGGEDADASTDGSGDTGRGLEDVIAEAER
ncbi:MAG: hypothetical protein V5A85_04285, partial [Haloarculaceae archaeon]